MLRLIACFVSIAVGILSSPESRSGIIYSTPTTVYSEGFNSLPVSGNNLTWVNDTTVAGWSLFDSQGTSINTYGADNGISTTGSFYSYGASANAERSLGALGNGSSYFGSPSAGSTAGHMAVEIINGTGLTLNTIVINYMGKQWRSESVLQQMMTLEYGYGSTFSSVGNWIAPGGNFNFSGPVFGPVGVPVDGNSIGLVTGRGGTLSNQTWLSGQTLWVRWKAMNEVGGTHAFAVDNFQLQAGGVPEPSGMLSILLVGPFITVRRKRLPSLFFRPKFVEV